jgi:hypothetical protein
MATLVLRTVKGSPLTNQEVDDNFNNLNTDVQAKLDASTYTAADILTKLKTVDGAGSGLDADSVHGLVGSLTNTPSSLVGRDSNGDIFFETGHATLVISNFEGNLTGNVTGNVSGTALNITGIAAVNNGGTGASDASGARTNLGLGSLSTQNYNNVNITGGSIAGITALAIADGGTGSTTASQARTNLGLNIGSDVQPFNNILTILSGVTPASDKISYFSTSSAAAVTDFTAFGRSLVGQASVSTLKTLLSLNVGSDIQAYDADLAALAALATTGIIVRTGAGTVASRTLQAGANISITNSSGVSGDPTIAVTGLAAVATSGSYNDLSNKPTIVGQIQSNWTQTNNAQADFIKNKPTLATVATSGSYNDLSNKPTLAAVATSGSYADLINKPNTVPSGLISLWYGNSTNIPAGWVLCNGSNGTPDLRDRFVIGAGGGYSAGTTGGSADSIVVSHTHTATSTVNDPGHHHQVYGHQSVGGNTAINNNSGTSNPAITGSESTSTENTGVSVSTSISATGNSGTNANLPPYYALCYIMKT